MFIASQSPGPDRGSERINQEEERRQERREERREERRRVRVRLGLPGEMLGGLVVSSWLHR